MRVEVCHADAHGATRIDVRLDAGATVQDAIDASGIVQRLALDLTGLGFSVFGRRATVATVLVEGDRVELLRPLLVDPMEARRRRAQKKAATRAATGRT